MNRHFRTLTLIACLVLAGATIVTANPDDPGRHGKQGLTPLADLNLSAKQTKEIRTLRQDFEEAIAPLKIQEFETSAELNILWLQIRPDTNNIETAQKKLHDIRYQLMKKETDFRIAVRNVLTEDQISRMLALGSDPCQGFDDKPGFRPHPQQRHRGGF